MNYLYNYRPRESSLQREILEVLIEGTVEPEIKE